MALAKCEGVNGESRDFPPRSNFVVANRILL